MPWRGHTGRFCHGCGRHRDECGSLSARYLCIDCGEAALLENVRGIRDHTGPAFARWRRGMAAAVGVILPHEHEPANHQEAPSADDH